MKFQKPKLMPNWCDTTYKLVGKHSSVERCYNALYKIYVDHIYKLPKTDKEAELQMTADEDWIGHIGTCILSNNPYSYSHSRGFVTNISREVKDKHTSILTLNASCAWSPVCGVLEDLANKYNLEFNYLGVEFGLEVFVKHDPSNVFSGYNYLLQIDCCDESYGDLDEVKDTLENVDGFENVKQCNTLEEVQDLISQVNNKNIKINNEYEPIVLYTYTDT